MDHLQTIHMEIDSRYTYDPHTPKEAREGYWVYRATHNDLKIPMTLRVISRPAPDLVKYLKRLKEMKVDNVIKIYEIFEN